MAASAEKTLHGQGWTAAKTWSLFMSIKKLGEPQWQKIRDGRDFVARDQGVIGKEVTNLAPPSKSALNVVPSIPAQDKDILRIDLGKTADEMSPFSASIEEIYKRFKEVSVARDIFERWIKRIGWSMYHQRRIMDKEAIDSQLEYAEVMRELLYATMLKWKDQRVRLNKISKEDFVDEIHFQLRIRQQLSDEIKINAAESRQVASAKSKSLIRDNADLRDEAFMAWKKSHRSAKAEYFADGDWARQLKKEFLENLDAQASLRAMSAAIQLASYQQAASIHVETAAKPADTGNDINPVIKIVPGKV
jgi:hypothetical protein